MKNLQRGLGFSPGHLSKAILIVFTDELFADNTINMHGNLIHWSSAKCKRGIRSVFCSETYSMFHGFDLSIALTTTSKMTIDRQNL
jgi:hypothetical protein